MADTDPSTLLDLELRKRRKGLGKLGIPISKIRSAIIPPKSSSLQSSGYLLINKGSEVLQEVDTSITFSEPIAHAPSSFLNSSVITDRRADHAPVLEYSETPSGEAGLHIMGKSTTKETMEVAGRFAQSVIKVLPDLLDGNPVKIAFSIARVIINTKDAINDSQQALNSHILTAAERLDAVRVATDDGSYVPYGADDAFRHLTKGISDILQALEKIKGSSLANKLLDHEDQARKVQQLFEKLSTITETFQLQMAVQTQRTVDRIDSNIKREALQNLQPVRNAHFDARKPVESLKRETCAGDTRQLILQQIQDWIGDSSPLHSLFWLTGHAGSGKTTILYTIAKLAGKEYDDISRTALGGSFFCSRHFAETRDPNCIIPTIANQLAGICAPYGDALLASRLNGTHGPPLETTSMSIQTQITRLLVVPWQQCSAKRTRFTYLIVIDGLDEMDHQGHPDFLHHLLDAIHSHKLGGLKFLVASRTDPNIQKQIKSFPFRKELWLQHLPTDQALADVRSYLHQSLPNLRPESITKLEQKAGGLFIYAATAARFLNPGPTLAPSEQEALLDRLLSYSANTGLPSAAPFLIDSIYREHMVEAFTGIPEPLRSHRLSILHLFLSTSERETPETIAALLGDNDDSVALIVAQQLHAVLHIQEDGRVSWYHTSFPDFIFDPTRSVFTHNCPGSGEPVVYDFSCSRRNQQKMLWESCFAILNSQLKFNNADIRSSYSLDSGPHDLDKRLVYAALHWSDYLPEADYPHNLHLLAEAIRSFLELRALYWIELMNLQEKVDLCEEALERVQKWTAKLQMSGDTYALIQDLEEVKRFVAAYVKESCQGRELFRSTPHLYISHLAAWSEPGRLVAKWRLNFSKLPVPTWSATCPAVIFKDGIPSTIFPPSSSRPLSPVWSVVFLAEDTQIISGHLDGSIVVWHAETGEPLRRLAEGGKGIRCIAISEGGMVTASCSTDGTVRVWDTQTGNLTRNFEGHRGPVSSVAVSKSGHKVVSGSQDCSVRVWDLSSGTEEMVLTGHTDWVLCVCLSSDGAMIFSGSKDKQIRVWDAYTGSLLRVLEGHTDRVNAVAVSSADALLASGSNDGTVRLWNAATGRPISVLLGHSSWVHAVAISYDGTTIVSGSRDRTVRVWNADTGEELQVLHGHTSSVFSVALSNDGTRVVSGSYDGSIRVWDISGRSKRILLKSLEMDSIDARCIDWRLSSDNQWIVSSESEDQRLMWNYGQVADPSNIFTIGEGGYGSIDFSQSIEVLGDNWTKCYTPVTEGGTSS